MQHIRISLAGIALALTPSSALACSLIVSIDRWFVPMQIFSVVCLLVVVWVGGKKVWMGHVQLALLSAAAAYVYAHYGTYSVAYKAPILSVGCGHETHYSIAGMTATWALLTLGLYAAGKPLITAFSPTIPYRLLAQTIRWFSALVVFGMYMLLILSFLVRLYTAP